MAIPFLRLTELLPDLTYDVCVLTGDYRGAAFGPFDAALDGLSRLRSYLKDRVYGVLGNHDTIRVVPGLEEMGIRMLLNESEHILRGDQAIYLAGIDDAHYYRVDNIEKAAIRNSRRRILNPPVFDTAYGLGTMETSRHGGYTSVGVRTSVVPVRINCLPEITLHHLQCSA